MCSKLGVRGKGEEGEGKETLVVTLGTRGLIISSSCLKIVMELS